jgi:pimeloyl-ACP methyl ester carboxylesterase
VSQLGREVVRKGHRFFQPLLRSSNAGYGNSSLLQDVEDLKEFLEVVKSRDAATEDVEFVLMGHSTGCQDIVTFLLGRESLEKKFNVAGVILQGQVSDRDAFDAAVEADEFLPRTASALIGRPHQGDPITARRFLSLNGKQSEDDMFSSDLTQEYMAKRLGHVQCPALLIFSGKDEFYPRRIDVKKLAHKIAGTFKTDLVQMKILENAGHFLQGFEDELVNHVLSFLDLV